MAKQYFTDSMTYLYPESGHRLCWQSGSVTLQQRNLGNFLVRYGKQVDAELSYHEACAKLGQALMHEMAYDGEIET